MIIFVFDPLAVLLLIASQYTFDFARGNNGRSAWRNYEQARAQKIVENSVPDEEQGNDVQHTMAESNGDDEQPEQSEPAKEEKEEVKQTVTDTYLRKMTEPVTLSKKH